MAQKSRPDPNNGTVVTADEYEALGFGYVKDGVYGTPDDTPVVYADSTGRQVKIRAGKMASVRGYLWFSDPTTDEIISNLPANTSTYPRIDRLYLRLDRSTRQVRTYYAQGTPAAVPSAPPPVTDNGISSGVFDVPLARWQVAAGYTTIAAADVINEAWYPQPSGPILCNSANRVWSTHAYKGMEIYETDTGRHYVYNGTSGGYISSDPLYVSTAGNPPAGGSRFIGMEIYETDTKKYWTWDGTYWRPRPGTVLLAISAAINVTNLDNGLRSVWTYSWTPPCPGTYEFVAITPTDGVAGEEAKFWWNINGVNFDDHLVRFFSNSQVSQVRLGIGKRYNVASTAAMSFGVNSQRNQGGSLFNCRAGNRYVTITYCGQEGITAGG